jgi:hypothetical protein
MAPLDLKKRGRESLKLSPSASEDHMLFGQVKMEVLKMGGPDLRSFEIVFPHKKASFLYII